MSVFDLTAQSGRSTIVAGGKTKTWGINGPILGPTLRARRGEAVRIDFRNTLDEATTLHWHGMHLPAKADGGPHQMIAPGKTWHPEWVVNQPAATLWYHPHPHGKTERHVYRGLGGMFILDDDQDAALSLPRDYGVNDIPLIVQDKTFDSGGQLVETSRRDNGMIGDTILVNGTAAPYLDITAELTRLRVLNASTARSYNFGFSDDRTFAIIGTDGGLLSTPVEATRTLLTPGERIEIVIRMRPSETVRLRSYPQDLGLWGARPQTSGANDTADIIELRAAATLTPSPNLPGRLNEIERLTTDLAATTRTFDLNNNRINGQAMDMARIDETVTVDTTETWEVWNSDEQAHNFHVHDVQFQILDIDGTPPPPELAGWKDTVYIPPGSGVTLIMRFTEYTDPTTPYMYHCHMLWHEDQGMMGQFLILRPGQEPAYQPPTNEHHH
ncbi:multicopper oxidase family protein [Streptomyces sp. NPDC059255]|uniref:multicopper oxidase family protein n=1 Tax=Streptomyces sp. NPDC059255 TaxID=3346793 RepID=UPI0036B69C47